MRFKAAKISWVVVCVVCVTTGMLPAPGVQDSAHAQWPLSSSANGLLGVGGPVRNFLDYGIPGAFDAALPVLFPPRFGGELRFRPVLTDLIKGTLEKNGRTVDLETDDGISLSSKGAYFQTMARLQFSRLSLRVHWDVPIRDIPARSPDPARGLSGGYVNWLHWRFGADFDIVDSYGVRAGINLDVNPEKPALHYSLRWDPSSANQTKKVDGYWPVTVGVHAQYNPFTSWIVSPSLEFRYRAPWPFRSGMSPRAQLTHVTEWEYAIGIKLPKTVLGSTGIRYGYQDTKMSFGGTGETGGNTPVSLWWSGQFLELVWFY